MSKSSEAPANIPDLIHLWPNPPIATFARDLGISTEHGATLKRRRSIPVRWWPRLVEAAKARKIKGVNYDTLVAMHAGGK